MVVDGGGYEVIRIQLSHPYLLDYYTPKWKRMLVRCPRLKLISRFVSYWTLEPNPTQISNFESGQVSSALRKL